MINRLSRDSTSCFAYLLIIILDLDVCAAMFVCIYKAERIKLNIQKSCTILYILLDKHAGRVRVDRSRVRPDKDEKNPTA